MKTRNQNIIGAKKNDIAKRAIAALSNLKNGSVKRGSVKDLYKDIESIPRRLYDA